jgi:hypothetical protein
MRSTQKICPVPNEVDSRAYLIVREPMFLGPDIASIAAGFHQQNHGSEYGVNQWALSHAATDRIAGGVRTEYHLAR